MATTRKNKTADAQSDFQSNNHNGSQLLEDMGQVVASLFGTVLSGRSQLRSQAQQRIELLLQHLPVATRDEVATLQAMLQQARLEQEQLKRRLAVLEGKSKSPTPAKQNKSVNEKLTPREVDAKKSSASRNKTHPR